MLKKEELLDLQFVDARARLIDLAAFLDRLDRHEGSADIRLRYFKEALPILLEDRPDRAKAVLEKFSDHSSDLPETAPFQGATGAPVN
ncbi:MAG: hypothetical protein NWT08_12080 [Akkermansiaceae bacterium]|jgi:hypothetical protein|nr:hypothetical protein [Akkermansiaceae bacterium]MDP4722077.1 hypothetical protein [Akkermansiaceae bacterium]MDP4781439.1 hypothetical protein [Akkermansiaceae bacterium]MDP4848072.1 hypothetical protein [Akkermansiaceae bacterium]MDP4899089.1 hypothetical protein [Akkermansiaceae bacterium]